MTQETNGQNSINGYRPLNNAQRTIMNENKVLEELVLRQIDRHVRNRDSTEFNQRFVAIARTKMQEAFMALNRSVAQPQRLIGPLEQALPVVNKLAGVKSDDD